MSAVATPMPMAIPIKMVQYGVYHFFLVIIADPNGNLLVHVSDGHAHLKEALVQF